MTEIQQHIIDESSTLLDALSRLNGDRKSVV